MVLGMDRIVLFALFRPIDVLSRYNEMLTTMSQQHKTYNKSHYHKYAKHTISTVA